MLAEHKATSRFAELAATFAVPDQAIGLPFQFFWRIDLNCSSAREQMIHRVLKIPHARPKRDRRTVARRLDHVLTAPRCETAADERDVGQAPDGGELSEGVDEEDG